MLPNFDYISNNKVYSKYTQVYTQKVKSAHFITIFNLC